MHKEAIFFFFLFPSFLQPPLPFIFSMSFFLALSFFLFAIQRQFFELSTYTSSRGQSFFSQHKQTRTQPKNNTIKNMKISFVYIAALVCAHQLLLTTTVKAFSVDAQLPGQSRAPSAPGSAVAVAAAGRGGGGSMASPASTTPTRGDAAAIAEAQAQADKENVAANAAARAAQAHAQSKTPRPSAPASGLTKGTTKRSSIWATGPSSATSGSTTSSFASSGNWAKKMLSMKK